MACSFIYEMYYNGNCISPVTQSNQLGTNTHGIAAITFFEETSI